MPKVTYLGTQPRRDPIKDAILGQQKRLGKTDTEIAKYLNICRGTYNSRMNKLHTNDWPLGDVVALWHKLGLPIEELRANIKF